MHSLLRLNYIMKTELNTHRLFLYSLIVFGVILSSCRTETDTLVTTGEMQMKKGWVKLHFNDYSRTLTFNSSNDTNPSNSACIREINNGSNKAFRKLELTQRTTQLPFSFIYNGKSSDVLLETWKKTTKTSKPGKFRIKRTITWTDPETRLEVKCIINEYSDYPAVEWTVYFKNNGDKNTPVIENIQGLDVCLIKESKEQFILNGNKGDMCDINSYEPFSQTLFSPISKKFSPEGGRSTNGPNSWPYYNLQVPGGGIIMAVGWPGQWASYFILDDKNSLRVLAGQELTHLYLKPGEEIRTPLMVHLFWEGSDIQRSQNIWRRWMISHNLPRTADNNLPEIQIVACSSHLFAEMTKANEENQKYLINRYLEEGMKIDYWWMDAGWYPCDSTWWKVGTWEPDSVRFPNGLKAVSVFAHARGIKTILWLEPERVYQGSWIERNHKEWLLSNADFIDSLYRVSVLFNFGNPDARKWMTSHVNKLIDEQGIDFYRQDFNMDPLHYWRSNDSPDRQGITENLYLQGLLAYWDDLRLKHPGLRIDECASGGRRNDLEMMRRATPLIRSDYLFEPISQQCHQMEFSSWIPYHGAAYPDWGQNHKVGTYDFRSNMSPSMNLTFDLRLKDFDYNLARLLFSQLRQIGKFYLGDYFPLTKYSLLNNVWVAWQYHLQNENEGMINAFRRDSCLQDTLHVRLKELNTNCQYLVWDIDRGKDNPLAKKSGKEFMTEGLSINNENSPSATILLYGEIVE